MKIKMPSWRVIGATAIAGFITAVGVLAALPDAVGTVKDAGGWVGDQFQSDPTRAEDAVDRFVQETKAGVLDWSHGPTIAEPSLDYFRRHFDKLDPERTHPLSIKDMNGMADVGGLAEGAPNLAGRFILLRARVASWSQTAAYGPVTSWAFRLYDRKPTDPVVVYCRVPLPTSEPPSFSPGDSVSATGVWIADGGVENDRGRTIRVIYMACSAIGTSIRFTNKPPTKEP